MATYKDVLLLIDKVSAPLKKIQENTRKATEKTNKLRESFITLTSKMRAVSTRINAVGGKLAAFGRKVSTAFAAITGTITLISGAILRGANHVADYGDRIDKMSQKIGMSRKSFQEWDYIMSQNGGNVESLQMGFKTLTTQIEGVQKGSKDSIKAFKALGVSVKDNNGKFRSQDDIFNDVVRALQKMKDPTQKAILENRLFGRSAAEMRPLLNQSADAIDELREKANKMGLIISDKELDNAVKYKDTMDTFQRFFQAKFANVMMKVMPDMSKALEDIMAIMHDNQEIFNNIGQVFKWTIGTALPAVIKSIVWVANGLKNIGGWIGTVLGKILSIPTYISMAFNTLKTNITISMINIGKAIGNIANKIKSIFSGVIQTILQWIQNIIDKITWVLNKIPGINKFLANKDIGEIINNSQTNNDNRQWNSNDNRSNFGNTYQTVNNYNSMLPLASAQYYAPVSNF